MNSVDSLFAMVNLLKRRKAQSLLQALCQYIEDRCPRAIAVKGSITFTMHPSRQEGVKSSTKVPLPFANARRERKQQRREKEMRESLPNKEGQALLAALHQWLAIRPGEPLVRITLGGSDEEGQAFQVDLPPPPRQAG